ncbi:MAG: Rne/Rng family ribonuclease [Syntrophobacterales bacterium]|nr:MAG: Rne/Rng family ribonuclease [Syntrophobacterales bacterium]
MSNQLVINVTPQETRVALLEDGMLAELYIERTKGRSIVGNIFKGKVVKVLPGMQAAFVDIGLEKAAFLYVSDVYRDIEEYDLMLEEGLNGEGDFEFEMQGIPSYLSQPSQIEDLLCEGEEILVQVSKEPIGTKGTRVTSHFTLPSRYLVLMPTVDHVGISRRIKDHDERRRLMEITRGIKPQGLGFIVRTASEGGDTTLLKGDMDFLLKLWDNIQRKKEKCSAPCLVHSDLNIVLRVIRDLLSPDVPRVIVDDRQEYLNIINFTKTYMPKLKCDIEIYEDREPIFDTYGIEMEIDKSLGRKVWLKSGGYIVIEMTEALTAIDVNTGRFVGKRNLEDTILKTNLEATKEIAYQLRLRDIGGIIIIDFIDMERDGDRERVYLALEEALKKDRTKTNILKISELGLVEMTRKRTRESVPRILCEPCNNCDGAGHVKSKTTVCYDIFREVERTASGLTGTTMMVDVNPEVADLLYDEERMGIEYLERKLNKKIVIKAKDGLHQDQFKIVEV